MFFPDDPARGKRKVGRVMVELSVASNVPAAAARRELRTRVNELCCHSLEDGSWQKPAYVRVKSVRPAR
jgi:hypothetical protein